MTQEEKQLLLKDLCARLPYNTLAECGTDYDFQNDITDTVNLLSLDIDSELCRVQAGDYVFNEALDTIKPYLRPMSSMTEEEIKEYDTTFAYYGDCPCYTIKTFDFLNKKHFDYRGLIPKGLALEAYDGMYDIKTE